MTNQERPEQLRREYEDGVRALHYREDRWTRSARARRTNAKELRIVRGFLESVVEQHGPIVRILDLPCGTGRFRDTLKTHCHELLSMDASREMWAAAPPASGMQGSAHAIPLEDACVGAILCSRLLHHFEHPEQRVGILQELARVSRRWVILSYFDAANFQAWRNRLRGRFKGRYPISRSIFATEIGQAELVERKRVYIQRGLSEQVWVLLEKQA
ncbi:MAG: class I SAM-dependent methyltransferase [Planctomycetota bacterium]